MVLGAFLLIAEQAVSLAAADGRARIGSPISFEARDTTYTIAVVPDPTMSDPVESRIARLRCTVLQPDETISEFNAGKANVRLSTSVGVFAAKFPGQPGTTTVTCKWTGGGLGSSYFVARSHERTQLTAFVLFGLGFVLTLAGTYGVVIGLRGRPEIQPTAEHPTL